MNRSQNHMVLVQNYYFSYYKPFFVLENFAALFLTAPKSCPINLPQIDLQNYCPAYLGQKFRPALNFPQIPTYYFLTQIRWALAGPKFVGLNHHHPLILSALLLVP